jgi:hypothetical protein
LLAFERDARLDFLDWESAKFQDFERVAYHARIPSSITISGENAYLALAAELADVPIQ